MTPPTKEKPGAGELTGRKLTAFTQYGALTLTANVFGAVFWFIEQRRWRVADRINDERSAQ
jgi:hypothetical protein